MEWRGDREMEYTVDFLWDDEAQVWVATSDEIPGLVLEGGSADALSERVKYTVPEILILNGAPKATAFLFRLERKDPAFTL